MNLTWKVKVIIASTVLLIISLLCLIIKYQHDLIVKNQMIEKSMVEFKQLSNDIVRNQGNYASKEEIEKIIKANNVDISPIKKDLEKLDAKIESISIIVSSSSGYKKNNLSSTSTQPIDPKEKPPEQIVKCKDGESIKCPSADPNGYLTNKQFLEINEQFGTSQVPIGEVEFEAYKAKPWGINIFPRNYKTFTVLGVDEEGRHYAYSKFNIEVNNKSYSVKIDKANYIEEYPTAKFRFGTYPYLGLNVGSSINNSPRLEIAPSLEIFLLSYGKTKLQPNWLFFGLGLGYETQAKKINLTASPIEYNVAQHLPLVKNIFIGPSVSINSLSNISAFVNIKLSL